MTQQPVYPAQPQYPYPQAPQPQQAYPPQPTYPQQPQGYAPPAQFPQQPQQPAQPLASGTIDDFYNQPSSGGGPSLKFEQVGTRYVGIVARAVGPGDVQQQTNTQGVPLFFKDGRPKFVMKVPLQMQPSEQYPEGVAQWYVKGGVKDELSRAMAEAGAPAGAPEAGAVLDITFVGTRNAGVGMNPAKVFQVRYQRPEGAAAVPTQPAPQSVQEQPAPVQQVQQPAQPVAVPQGQPVQQVQVQQPQAQVPGAASPAPGAASQPAAPQPPAGMTPEQQALLAKITGQQQGTTGQSVA